MQEVARITLCHQVRDKTAKGGKKAVNIRKNRREIMFYGEGRNLTIAWQMMLDAASHIIRNSIAFEAFLFVYLVCATWIQNLNIYKSVCVCLIVVFMCLISSNVPYCMLPLQNLYLIDYDLFLFVVLVLSRRLVWCALQELQSKFTHLFPAGWNSRYWIIGAVGVGGVIMIWSVLKVVQNASLFNLLFLFYP